MKNQLTVAVTAGLLALGAAVPAFAQNCGPGTMIEFDANAFAYESNYNPATLVSAAGSQLNVVGIISLWCTPFADLNANDPNTEYTFLFTNLTSAGTVVSVNGPTTNYDTNYGNGSFAIYAGSPRNAPTAGSMPINPPNATVPANFTDGTLILNGTLTNFTTGISRTLAGPPNGSFRTNYNFTGPAAGTYYLRVQGTGPGLIQGNWCVVLESAGGCVPQGYSAHPNGKFDVPPTANRMGTWGTLKQLYR
jgi:hypothetical protein